MTHPFHPLCGREFELANYRFSWGKPRVYFHDDTGRLCSVPAEWTSAGPADPFVEAAGGRAPFRFDDLVDLAELIREINDGM